MVVIWIDMIVKLSVLVVLFVTQLTVEVSFQVGQRVILGFFLLRIILKGKDNKMGEKNLLIML